MTIFDGARGPGHRWAAGCVDGGREWANVVGGCRLSWGAPGQGWEEDLAWGRGAAPVHETGGERAAIGADQALRASPHARDAWAAYACDEGVRSAPSDALDAFPAGGRGRGWACEGGAGAADGAGPGVVVYFNKLSGYGHVGAEEALARPLVPRAVLHDVPHLVFEATELE